jgi:bacillithiol synthase
MESSCVRQTLIPGTSKLFGDYLYDFHKVSDFYGHFYGDPESFAEAAKRIDFPQARRASLVSALREQNGDSPALEKLAVPGTVAVVTGQQVGLFSGPAYTIFKALTAAKLADRLSADGIPAVPVFWLATEDHDLAEVDHAWVFNQNAAAHRISFSPGSAAGGPVGEVVLGEVPIQELRAALGDLPFADEVVARLESAYRPGATLGSAFGSFLKDVLREVGLLFIDPLSPAVRQIAAPFLESAGEAVPELVNALRQRDQELKSAGYHSQVHVEPDTSLLFVISNGKRVPLRWRDGKFVTRDGAYAPSNLRNGAPALSPNALLRPVMQDYILPTVAYIGGPAEIAYMAQAQVLYQRLLGRMPVIFPRNSFTLLDARATKIMDRFGLRMTDLLDYHEHARARIAATLIPAELEDELRKARAAIASSIDCLQSNLTNFDSTLQAAAKKSGAKILFQVDKVSRKTASEMLRRDQRAARDADYLMNLIYPERHLQERFYSIVPFLAKTGFDLPARLMEQTQLACPDHMVRSV